jgi:hypothetical protein
MEMINKIRTFFTKKTNSFPSSSPKMSQFLFHSLKSQKNNSQFKNFSLSSKNPHGTPPPPPPHTNPHMISDVSRLKNNKREKTTRERQQNREKKTQKILPRLSQRSRRSSVCVFIWSRQHAASRAVTHDNRSSSIEERKMSELIKK